MRRYIAILISLACIIFGMSLSATAKEALSYTFDDGSTLTTVTNTLLSGGNVVYGEGEDGKCIELDGSYGLLLGEVGDTFSVSARIKITSTGGTNTIFFKNMGTKQDQKWTGVLSNEGKPAFWTYGDGYRWSTVASSDEAVLNSWAEVLYVENKGVGALYVNDVLIGKGNVARGSGQLYLGVTYWEADASSGFVDNVRLYTNDITNKTIDIQTEVIGDIELPESMGTKTLEWKTSDASVITVGGKVNRYDTDKTVTLTAYADGEVAGEFEVTVLKKPVIVNNEALLCYEFKSDDGDIIRDTTGNGNHAAAFGGLKIGEEGAVFDGVDDYVKMPDGVLYGHDDVTIVVTFKPEGAQKHTFLYGFGNTADTGYMFLNPSAAGTNTIRFAATQTNYAQEKELASLPGIRSNEWATVAVVLNGGCAAMYIDGDLVMDGDVGMKVSSLGETVANYIAKSLYDTDRYFAGTVKRFEVFNYAMSESEVETLYKKAVEYAPEKENEEYITAVSFRNGIDITLDTRGRDDVKIGAVVLDENNEVVEFAVVNNSEDISLEKSGRVLVFAFNEEDNIPGSIYVKGENEQFKYEYTPDKIEITSNESYENGMVIIAGYDIAGALTGVSLSITDIKAGESVELEGNFGNAVEFRMLYWGASLLSIVQLD